MTDSQFLRALETKLKEFEALGCEVYETHMGWCIVINKGTPQEKEKLIEVLG